MASLEELDKLVDSEHTTRQRRLEQLRAHGRLRADRLLGTGNPDLDRAAEALIVEEMTPDDMLNAGLERLDALLEANLDTAPEKQTTLIVQPQPVVDTSFNVVRGRVYVYDHLPSGAVIQRDVTSQYMQGSHGRIPQDATRRPFNPPVVMQSDGKGSYIRKMNQTQHDAHCGAVCD